MKFKELWEREGIGNAGEVTLFTADNDPSGDNFGLAFAAHLDDSGLKMAFPVGFRRLERSGTAGDALAAGLGSGITALQISSFPAT